MREGEKRRGGGREGEREERWEGGKGNKAEREGNF